MTFCPWNGVKDCGCGSFPFSVNGKAPARCEELMPIYVVGSCTQFVSDAKKAEYMAWWKAGQPRLGVDDDDGEPDYAQGG